MALVLAKDGKVGEIARGEVRKGALSLFYP